MADVEQRWLTDPTAVIAEAVMAAEPTLNRTVVLSVIETVIRHRPRRRDLARALVEDPQLLISGRPVGPRGIERLVRGLQEQGATNLVRPRCARCGKPNPLPSLHGRQRVCAYCSRSCARRPGGNGARGAAKCGWPASGIAVAGHGAKPARWTSTRNRSRRS